MNKSATFYFGDVMYGWYTKPQVMIWAADNGAGAYDVMYPYMQARTIPGSYMPTTDYLAAPNGNQITVSELQTMQANGWTIVPHQTIGTALTSMNESAMRAEIEEVLSVHRSYGFNFKDFITRLAVLATISRIPSWPPTGFDTAITTIRRVSRPVGHCMGHD